MKKKVFSKPSAEPSSLELCRGEKSGVKTNVIILSIAAFVALSVGALLAYLNPASRSLIFGEDVEALSSCEIKNGKGKVIFACDGNEGDCSAGHGNFTLECSGTKQAR